MKPRRLMMLATACLVYFSAAAASAVAYKATLLHPLSGYSDSFGYGVSGGSQAGYGNVGGNSHALLWSGTPASAVDLHPAGFANSQAASVSGSRQLGIGFVAATNQYHALLWQGTATSFVDLHPAGFTNSFGYNVSGNIQVGFGTAPGSVEHALLWRGTAASVVDLHPAGYGRSTASDVSGSNQVGYGGIGASNRAYSGAVRPEVSWSCIRLE